MHRTPVLVRVVVLAFNFHHSRGYTLGGGVFNGQFDIHRWIRYVMFAGVVQLLDLLLYRFCTARVLLKL